MSFPPGKRCNNAKILLSPLPPTGLLPAGVLRLTASGRFFIADSISARRYVNSQLWTIIL